jgi:hypothetical protein
MADAGDRARVDVAAGEVAQGQSLLSRISSEIVRTFKECYGKAPTRAKSGSMTGCRVAATPSGSSPSRRSASATSHAAAVPVQCLN